MKYYVARFNIECEPEQLQIARELLSASACEAGFEAFEDTETGIDGYVQRQLFDKNALDNALQEVPLEGVRVTYDVAEVEDQDWNAGWEEDGFEPIGVSADFIVYDAKHTDMSAFAGNDGVRRVFIEARNAFGTGTHQTTRMILRRLLSMDLHGRVCSTVVAAPAFLAFPPRCWVLALCWATTLTNGVRTTLGITQRLMAWTIWRFCLAMQVCLVM